jgi:hypothetical protein
MSAQVTEAHRELAYAILFATEDGHAGPNETAQLIADSEARATDQLRAEVDSIKQEIEMVEHRAYRAEAKISNQAERIRYLEGATNHATGTPLSRVIARAERAEAELAIERARLDWLDNHLNYELMITVFGEEIGIASDGGPRELRSAIDAAMKEHK